MQRKNSVFLGVSAVTTPPKRVSRFVNPWQGVSRFATVPWQYPKLGGCIVKPVH